MLDMSKSKNNVCSSQEHSSLSSCSSSSLSSDEEVDVRDLKPIREYLSDRKELARQLFKSVKPDKIRMMLPQILKQVDLNELEQWCISELNGMSKTRILSILNDKPMLESSNTSESDDSGPSLEIISDTEEWLTDDEGSRKEDDGKRKLKRNKMKVKGKIQVKTNFDKSYTKGKHNNKYENNDNNQDVKIKKEDSKDKEKDGDSLLDLLELEMRARAIRALIRKEEDIIPTANLSQTSNGQTVDRDNKILQEEAKAKEDCRKQLERIINAKQGNIGEDEDVVLVVQPTPVVELLSSDSDKESHGTTRRNQKLENERTANTEKSIINFNDYAKNSKLSQDSKEKKETQETIEIQNNSSTIVRSDVNEKKETRTKITERNVDIRNNTLSISISTDNVVDKRKKLKKKSRSKSQLASNTKQESLKLKRIKATEIEEQSNDTKDKDINKQSKISPISDDKNLAVEKEDNTKEGNSGLEENCGVEKDRSADSDEIIDLDDYCDVMDMENCDEDKSQDKIIAPPQQDKQLTSQVTPNLQMSESSETWASRYYQTDDVQNVIKDSKIQSEIRKRLRERQRLSKLNKSPKTNLNKSESATDPTTNVVSERAPTGSVEEYLALKRATNTNVNADNNDNSTTQNIIPVNSNSDETTKSN